MAVNSFDRIFALSPNIRLESDETIETDCYLSEFRQLARAFFVMGFLVSSTSGFFFISFLPSSSRAP